MSLPIVAPAEASDLEGRRRDLPTGWECEWDAVHKRHYYFNRTTQERTWNRPQKAGAGALAVPKASTASAASASGSPRAAPPAGSSPSAAVSSPTRSSPGGAAAPAGERGGAAGITRRTAGTAWNAEDFGQRLAKAKATKERNYIKSVLKEVAENNYALRHQWPVPRTVPVSLEQCQRSRVTGMGPDPEVSFSSMTTADALLFYARSDPSRKVVGLNFANGQKVGGGYKNGAVAQEEDLCRRMPTLYTSLNNALRDGQYPFGPCTCRDPKTPAKYSDVLWTPDVVVARSHEDSGFSVLPVREQAAVALVAAAAPNIKFAEPPEHYSKELMLNTIKAVLIAPKMMLPDVTTIVLGAWGCGAFGGDPNDVAEIFCKALSHERLGRLYKEVHFAIPTFGNEDRNAEIFRQVFRKMNVKFKEVDNPFV